MIKIQISNAARMVLNAIATETGPLKDTELYLAGCDLTELLTQVPNIMKVGEAQVDIPRALQGVQSKDADDPQRIGVEQLAAQWRSQVQTVELSDRLMAVLRLQLEHILARQGDGTTKVQLSLTPVCREAVVAITGATAG